MIAFDAGVLSGRFSLEARLPDQGRFEAHRAIELTSRRRVVVRFLNSEDSIARAEIDRAAKAMMKLPHPGLVPVLDAGVHLGRVYVVTPLIEAPTLAQVLASGAQVVVPQAMKILAQVTEAIEHAHHGGVVHGAFGPHHVLLLADGRALVADAGIAHLVDLVESRGRPSNVPPPLPSVTNDLEALARLGELILSRRPSLPPQLGLVAAPRPSDPGLLAVTSSPPPPATPSSPSIPTLSAPLSPGARGADLPTELMPVLPPVPPRRSDPPLPPVHSPLGLNQRVSMPVSKLKSSPPTPDAVPTVPPPSPDLSSSSIPMAESSAVIPILTASVPVGAPMILPSAPPPPLPPRPGEETQAMPFAGPPMSLGPDARPAGSDTLPMPVIAKRISSAPPPAAPADEALPDMSRYTPGYVRAAKVVGQRSVEVWRRVEPAVKKATHAIQPALDRAAQAAGPVLAKAKDAAAPLAKKAGAQLQVGLQRLGWSGPKRAPSYPALGGDELSANDLRSAGIGWQGLSTKQRRLAIAGIALLLWFLVWVLSGSSKPKTEPLMTPAPASMEPAPAAPAPAPEVKKKSNVELLRETSPKKKRR